MMASVQHRKARFPSSLEATADLLEWFGQGRPALLDSRVWVQAQTALVEGFTNAVRHAQGALLDPPPIEVEMSLITEAETARLELRILDQGPPFDLASVWQALASGDTEANDPLDRDAHWGLIMLARLRSEHDWTIRYDRRAEGGNQLLLLAPPSKASA
jgi:serine/threonine-protein kinase RsbW